MAVTQFELYQVTSDFVTVDLIIWRRYLARAPGMAELMMDANPHLAFAHRRSPFIPPGVYVRVPIDPHLILGKPRVLPTDSLWTDQAGYQLRGQIGSTSAPVNASGFTPA
jgi:phage tail protein X